MGRHDGPLLHVQLLLLILLLLFHQQATCGGTIASKAKVQALRPSVVVCGGGAAGFFSAIECARVLRGTSPKAPQYSVTVLEAGQAPLSKVLISGGGRCNVMHDPMKTPSDISKGYPRGQRELIGALSSLFTPWDTYDWFSSKGIELKTEKDGRVFPITDKSESIIDILRGEAQKLGVEIVTGARVTAIAAATTSADTTTTSPGFDVSYRSGSTEDGDNTKTITAHRVIMATGSARPSYSLVQSLGHTITPPLPSLFSFKINEANLTALAGIATNTARVKLVIPTGAADLKEHLRPTVLPSYTQSGPLLITHQGLSGPAVLKLSAFSARLVAAMAYNFTIEVKWIGGGSGAGDVDLSDDDVLDHLNAAKKCYPTRQIGKGFPVLHLGATSPLQSDGYDDYDDDQYDDKYEGEGEGEDEQAVQDLSAGEDGQTSFSIQRRLWLYLLSRCSPPVVPTTKWRDVKPKEIVAIVNALLHSRYCVNGRGVYRDEFVTAGGVPLKEVNMKTMESTKQPGLYLCGELINIDGITGGFNFQSAWTTGFVAGNNAGRFSQSVE